VILIEQLYEGLWGLIGLYISSENVSNEYWRLI